MNQERATSMGLIGGMARTAVVAGTATAVSNRVSRRQAGRWAAQEQQQYAEQHARSSTPSSPSTPAASARHRPRPRVERRHDTLDQLQKLGELKAAGVLTEGSSQAQKAKILAG